jgi:hypothetical protein
VSRQGFYRLPLETIDAVKDGELTFSEWSLFIWLASNADYKTGLVRTSAPHLADGTGASVVTIRKALRKLRGEGWIFYTTVKSRSHYPIGIYNYSLGGGGRTATQNEWRLHYGKSTTLISASHSWINVWINVNNEFSSGQIPLRESADQSGGQSVRAAKVRRITGEVPAPPEAPGQSDGPSADQSMYPATAENPNVDLRSERSTHAAFDQHRTGELRGEVSPNTINLDGQIWDLYERKYRERTRSGINPGHSRKDADKAIKAIRYVLDPMRKSATTDDGYLRLLGDALDIYFRQQDEHVTKVSVKWNLQTFVARLPGILEEIERRVG